MWTQLRRAGSMATALARRNRSTIASTAAVTSLMAGSILYSSSTFFAPIHALSATSEESSSTSLPSRYRGCACSNKDHDLHSALATDASEDELALESSSESSEESDLPPLSPKSISIASQPTESIPTPEFSSSVSPPTSVSTRRRVVQNCPPCYAYTSSDMPLNRMETGRASWAYLHTLAAYYPDNPTPQQRQDYAQLIRLFMKLYPCGYCADRALEQIIREPLENHMDNSYELSTWMCRMHNEVNERLGKPTFKCDMVLKRWRDL